MAVIYFIIHEKTRWITQDSSSFLVVVTKEELAEALLSGEKSAQLEAEIEQAVADGAS